MAIEAEMAQPGFWDGQERANRTVQELKRTKALLDPFEACRKSLHDLQELSTVVEADDAASLKHLQEELAALTAKIGRLEFARLLGDERDPKGAILSIHAGAGGTESCDWAAMLMRMYTRYAEAKGYKVSIIDILPGEEAGVKSVTMTIEGDYAYGYLKAEEGVHRLVRISPFDSNKRRHTSFVSIDIVPEIEDDIEIAINPSEIKIDVYRSSGPGGQSVNTADSAVRITHLPTGIVVTCQDERSQLKNKQKALKVLRSRLYQRVFEQREAEQQKEYESKSRIEWGSQIRSYVLHPYSLIKDHRTNVEIGNTQSVLDGNLDQLIESYLKWKAGQKGA